MAVDREAMGTPWDWTQVRQLPDQPGRSWIKNRDTGRWHSFETLRLDDMQAANAAAAKPETSGAQISDYFKTVAGGIGSTVAGLGWLAKKIPFTEAFGTAVETLGNDAVDYWDSQMSEGAKLEAAKSFVQKNEQGEYEWGDAGFETIALMGARSLPSMVGGMGLGAGLAKVLRTFGNPIMRGALAETVKAGAKAPIGSPAALKAAAAAKKLKFVDYALAATGFGAGEALVAAPDAGASVERDVMKLPLEKLTKSDRWREVYDSADDMPEDERIRYATETIAKEASSQAGWESGLTTFLLGGGAGAFYGRLLNRGPAAKLAAMLDKAEKGPAPARIGAAAAVEAAQEFAQSGAQQLTMNRAMQGAGDDVDLFDQVLEQAVAGAVVGGAVGGGFGALSSRPDNSETPDASYENVLDAALNPEAAPKQLTGPPGARPAADFEVGGEGVARRPGQGSGQRALPEPAPSDTIVVDEQGRATRPTQGQMDDARRRAEDMDATFDEVEADVGTLGRQERGRAVDPARPRALPAPETTSTLAVDAQGRARPQTRGEQGKAAADAAEAQAQRRDAQARRQELGTQAPGPLPADEAPPVRPKIKAAVGRTDMAAHSDGERVATRWAVVELEDLGVSNDHTTGLKNRKYPQELQPKQRTPEEIRQNWSAAPDTFDAEQLMQGGATGAGAPIVGPDGFVESGNGRVMNLRGMADRRGLGEYTAAVQARAAELGINPQDVAKFRQPVLVRFRATPMEASQRADFAKRANQAAAKAADAATETPKATETDTSVAPAGLKPRDRVRLPSRGKGETGPSARVVSIEGDTVTVETAGPKGGMVTRTFPRKALKPFVRNSLDPPDPTEDSLVEYLARHPRGIDYDEAVAQGLDPSQLNSPETRVGATRRAFRRGGMSFDEAAELLGPLGYPVTDEKGNTSANAVLAALDRELRGRKALSTSNTRQAELEQAEQQARAADEAAQREAEAEEAVADAARTEEELAAEAASLDDAAIMGAPATEDLDVYDAVLSREMREAEDAIDAEIDRIYQREKEGEDDAGEGGADARATAGPAAEAAPGRDQAAAGARGAAPEGTDEGLTLTAQTPEELAQREAAEKRAAEAAAAQRREQEQRAQADSEALDFRLSGSSRPADVAVAGGQQSMFGATGRPTESDQDRSDREWRENYDRVVNAGDLSAISTVDLERADSFAARMLDYHKRKGWDGGEVNSALIEGLEREQGFIRAELQQRRSRRAAPAATVPANAAPEPVGESPEVTDRRIAFFDRLRIIDREAIDAVDARTPKRVPGVSSDNRWLRVLREARAELLLPQYADRIHRLNAEYKAAMPEEGGFEETAGASLPEGFFEKTAPPSDVGAARVPADATPEPGPIEGATLEELAEIGKAFDGAAGEAGRGAEQLHHLFDAPAKGEIVRLQDKVRVFTKDRGWMTPAEAKAEIAKWKANAAAQGETRANADKVVLSFFDLTGSWSQPWEDAGYQVWRFDIQNDPEAGDVNKFSVEFFGDWFGDFDGQDIHAILAACPCTDFASSGARHFAAKDADGRTVASVELVQQTLRAIEYFKPAVWAIENPVGRIESLTGLPPWRLSFDPNHLGDPYTKKTLLWGRFNADLPIAPVEPTEGSKMHQKYGGKSQKTKNARSVTPEGFAYAFFQANNAIDHPVMALASKFDRLDRGLIEQALGAGISADAITSAVEDFYYQELDDDAANQAIRDLIANPPEPEGELVPAPFRESEDETIAPNGGMFILKVPSQGRLFRSRTLEGLVGEFAAWRDDNGFGASDIGGTLELALSENPDGTGRFTTIGTVAYNGNVNITDPDFSVLPPEGPPALPAPETGEDGIAPDARLPREPGTGVRQFEEYGGIALGDRVMAKRGKHVGIVRRIFEIPASTKRSGKKTEAVVRARVYWPTKGMVDEDTGRESSRLGVEQHVDIADLRKAPPAPPGLLPSTMDGNNGAAAPEEPGRKRKQPAKPAAANTDDAGDELAYNRRNMGGRGITWADVENLNPTLRVKDTTKVRVWPKPDYSALVSDGMSPLVAHMLKQVYDALPAKPVVRGTPTDENLQDYIEGLTRVRTAINEWANDKDRIAEWASRIVSMAQASRGATMIEQIEVGRLIEKNSSLREAIFPGGFKDDSNRNRQVALAIGGDKTLRAIKLDFNSAIEATKAISKGWPAPQEAWEKRGIVVAEKAAMGLTVRSGEWTRSVRGADGKMTATPATWHSVEGLTSTGRFRVSVDSREEGEALIARLPAWIVVSKSGVPIGGGDTQEAAKEAARAQVKKETERGFDPKGTEVGEATRIGAPRRENGRNVSSEELMRVFGLRGVNFGNWMKGSGKNEGERQAHLNAAYDGLYDLAELLNIPPQAIGLNNLIGLAIGAQGTGKAAAHFVPGLNEINLTRTAGAGSLAHEWAHALDHYFAVQAGEVYARTKNPFATALNIRDDSSLRPEIRDAIVAVVRAMRSKPESEQQKKDRIEESVTRSRKRVKDWFAGLRRLTVPRLAEAKRPDLNAKFDAIEQRILAGDVGEGMKKYGSGATAYGRPIMAEIAALAKESTGRAADKDHMNGLSNNLDAYMYVLSAKGQLETHQPQMVRTDYLSRSAGRESESGKPYWATEWEMFARAFESYVMDRLADRAARNDYLVDTTKGEDQEALWGPKPFPYPKGEERKAINAAFDKLVGEIKTEQTDKGTRLYSRSGADPTLNSRGTRIAPTAEGVRNFWNWYGRPSDGPDSAGSRGAGDASSDAGRRVGRAADAGARARDVPDAVPATVGGLRFGGTSGPVDARGQPVVLFHGTRDDFDAFRVGHPNAKDHGWLGRGVYASTSPIIASMYASAKRGPVGQNVMPVYMAVRNPYIATPEDKDALAFSNAEGSAEITRRLIAAGHDGVVLFYPKTGNVELVAFDPKAVKSATGNRGTFDPTEESILRSTPTYYSALIRGVEALPQEAASAIQWAATIRNLTQKGVKQEEIDWLGVMDWLKGQPGKVSKQSLLDYLNANRVDVQEVVKAAANLPADGTGNSVDQLTVRLTALGYTPEFDDGRLVAMYRTAAPEEWYSFDGELWVDQDEEPTDQLPPEVVQAANELGRAQDEVALAEDQPSSSDVRYAMYQLPGGENYREILLTLPPPNWYYEGRRDTPAGAAGTFYRSGHWNEPNVLAHVRLNERTAADGVRTLFIEEIQSDWHQAGRKRGYSNDEYTPAQLAQARQAMMNAGYSETEIQSFSPSQVGGYLYGSGRTVPDAPFKTTWPELTLKRVIRYAAEGGFTRIAWTTGEQQADRYGIAKRVDTISYVAREDEPGTYRVKGIGKGRGAEWFTIGTAIPEAQLADYVGQGIAARIIAGEGEKQRFDGSTYLRGEGLKVGGEGMVGFYDKMLPSMAAKLGRKWGAKVGRTAIDTNSGRSFNDFYDFARANGDKRTEDMLSRVWDKVPTDPMVMRFSEPTAQHSMDIPPAMAEAAMAGLPLFQAGGIGGRGSRPAPRNAAQIRTWLDRAAAELEGAADIRIVEDIDRLRALLGDPTIEADVEGVYTTNDGTAYIVAASLPTLERAQEVFAHEVFGHLAMERSPDMAPAVRMVQAMHDLKSRTVMELWNEVDRRQNREGQPRLNRTDHAKEVIALMAERGVKNSAIDRLIAAAKGLLRKLGVTLQYSDAELRALIARAARALRRDAARLTGEDGALADRVAAAVKRIETAEGRRDALAARRATQEAEDALGRVLPGTEAIEAAAADPRDTAALQDLSRPMDMPVDPMADGAVAPTLDDALRAATAPLQGDRLYSKPAPMGAAATAARDRVMAGAARDHLPLKDRLRLGMQAFKNMDSLEAVQGVFDFAASIANYEKQLNGGNLLDASRSAYKKVLATQNLASVMGAVMQTGIPVWRNGGYEIAPGRRGLADIFAPLTANPAGNLVQHFELYAAARRASRLINERNPDGTSKEKLFTPADIAAGMALGREYPELVRVFDDWQAFNRQALDMMQEAGLIDAESRALWERNDYVPFYRAMDDLAGVEGPKNRSGVANQRSGVKTLTGRDAQLGNILENMLLNVAHAVDASFKNRAAQSVADMLDGVAMTALPKEWQPVDIPAPQMAKALREIGVDMDRLTADQREQWLKVFRRVAPAGPNVVTVMRGGKPTYYEVNDPLLLRSLTAMGGNPVIRQMDVLGLLSGAKRLLTSAVTAHPHFIIANFIRDTLATWVQSPLKIGVLTGAYRGFRDVLRNDRDFQALMAAGAGGGTIYDTSPESIRKILMRKLPENQINGFLSTIVSPKKMWSLYQKVQVAAENANRLRVYRAALAHGASQAEAAYQARDVLNFTMRGDHAAVQFLTMSVPFLNARLQGLYRLQRGYKQNRAAFLLRGSMLMAATLALLASNWDDERYQELQEWDRDAYWHVWLGEKHYRIPRPFEVGVLFATMPERGIRALTGEDDSRVIGQAMMRVMMDTFSFNPTPQLVRPIYEQYNNKLFFTGQPIVGRAQEGLKPEAQFNERTSATIIEIAKAMPDSAPEWMRSPMRLEALVRGYLGSMGMASVAAADSVTRAGLGYPDAPARSWEEIAFERFLRAGEPRSTKYTEELYRMAQEANEAAKTINAYRKQGRDEDAREAKLTYADQLKARGRLNKAVAQMRKLNEQAVKVTQSRTLSAEEKRDRLEKINARRNEISRLSAEFSDYF